jgi:hypothetical protein
MLNRIELCLVVLLLISGSPLVSAQTKVTNSTSRTATKLSGRWRVTFTFAGRGEHNLTFEAKEKNFGSFLLLDTGPDGKPEQATRSAAWSELPNERVSFSGEVELPIGTCCREIGTLVFKGRFKSENSVTGKTIFITSVDEEENPYQFRSLIGTFTATRLTD